MKQLALLFLCFPAFLFGQNFTITPSTPKPGDMVRLEIDLTKSKLRTASDIQMMVLEYTNGKAATTEAATMRVGDKLVGIFTLSPDAKSAVASLLEGEDNWDNNGGEGYFVTLHDAAGKPVPEGMVASAILYRDFGGLMNLNRTATVSMGLMNQAFSMQPATMYGTYLLTDKKIKLNKRRRLLATEIRFSDVEEIPVPPDK